ncbi:MAG: hypothetical protein KAK04_01385 [Cyclobacteriaceae bacterium]|nr:hypothetical protein [Cyclobacteriaceae bacterium]
MTSTGSISGEAQNDGSNNNNTGVLFILGFGFKKLQIAKNPYVAINWEAIIPESHGCRADVIWSAICLIDHLKYLFSRYGYKGHIII